MTDQLPAKIIPSNRLLTAAEPMSILDDTKTLPLDGSDRMVRAVMFIDVIPDLDKLIRSDNKTNALDAVITLIEMSNSYVLNDITVLASRYAVRAAPGPLGQLVDQELQHGDAIEIARHGDYDLKAKNFRILQGNDFKYDLTQFWEVAGLAKREDRLYSYSKMYDEVENDLDDLVDDDDESTYKEWKRMGEELDKGIDSNRIVERQACILFADHLLADVIPDQNLGAQAILIYPDFIKELGASVVKRREFREYYNKFINEVTKIIALPVERDHVEMLRQPSVLLERHCVTSPDWMA